MESNKIYLGNCLDVLKTFPDNSIDCCVTSPPYLGLRDYGHADQIGLGETPEMFVASLVSVFSEVKRVLKSEGTLWLNLGDSYAGSGKGMNGDGTAGKITSEKQQSNKGSILHRPTSQNSSTLQGGKKNQSEALRSYENVSTPNCKPKDLIGIPWLTALALRSSGWYLRQDIIWSKPNPMPESVTDRCTKAHEYIFLLSKSAKYYYNAKEIAEPTLTFDSSNRDRDNTRLNNTPGRTRMAGLKTNDYEFRNKRSVWTVSTKPFSEAHFATFPEDLIEDCIKAGCPVDGIVLDPFSGAGTTALVSAKLGRNYIGIELNEKYVTMSEKRLQNELGLFHKIG